MSDEPEKKKRGFAALTPEERAEVARQGGTAATAQGKAHRFNSEEAAAAGRKGGLAVSKNKEHMAEIGRKGGKAKRNKGNVDEQK